MSVAYIFMYIINFTARGVLGLTFGGCRPFHFFRLMVSNKYLLPYVNRVTSMPLINVTLKMLVLEKCKKLW